MDSDQYSLSNLRDIFIPDAPSLWPPAAGVWVALGLIIGLLLFAGWRVYSNRRRNAYRKAGLSLIDSAVTAHDVSVAMKRVALAAFPRERVASLYGIEWVAFLDSTCPRCDFSAMIAIDSNPELDQEFIGLAKSWIRHHLAPEFDAPVVAN